MQFNMSYIDLHVTHYFFLRFIKTFFEVCKFPLNVEANNQKKNFIKFTKINNLHRIKSIQKLFS